MGTTHYNLTQPLSTDRFNLQVWNDNLEQIDQRMYLNQTTTFNGATELVDGTVGNVPAPAIADKDKYLKGDGTWDTPSGGSGAGAAEMTMADYNALTTQQKNDGTIRFIPAGSGGGSTSAVDMSSLEIRKESAMAATATSSTETTITWNGGGNIGCTVWRTAAIDVTDYRTIKFTVTNGTTYNSVNRPTNPNPDWVLQIGLQTTEPSGIQSTTESSSIWEAVAAFPLANHTYDGEIDVSELTGTYYLVINAHGNNTVIEDITLDTGGVYPSQIKYMSKTYADSSGGGSASGVFDLWTGTQTPAAPAPVNVTLSSAYTDFDMLIVDCAQFSLSGYKHTFCYFPVSSMATSGSYYATGYGVTISVTCTDSTHLALAGTTNTDVTFFAVKGIKL